MFQYESPRWTDEVLINENTGPATDADDEDAKFPAFISQPLGRLKVCYKTLSNCVTYELGQEYASARALFSGGFVRSDNMGQGSLSPDEGKRAWTDLFLPPGDSLYDTFWNGGSGSSCGMLQPGINTQCRDHNFARIGYCSNIPSQACLDTDGSDADSSIGIGLKFQANPGALNSGFAWYFLDVPGGSAARSQTQAHFQAQAWVFALPSTAAASSSSAQGAAGWVKGPDGSTCDAVCGDIGRVCDPAQQSSLTTNALVAAAFAEAGYTCRSFHGARNYAGTPFSKGTSGDDCAPFLAGSTQSSCTGNAYGHHAPLCACV